MSEPAGSAHPVRSAAVIVASTSAAGGRAADRTGPVIRDWLEARGFEVPAPIVVGDGAPVAVALSRQLALGRAVILTTGGTGVSPSDLTPEQTAPLLEVQLPGLVEELRRRGSASTPAALITRGVAGFSGDTFIMNLPGSPGGVRDGLDVLSPLLGHLLEQRMGRGVHEGGAR